MIQCSFQTQKHEHGAITSAEILQTLIINAGISSSFPFNGNLFLLSTTFIVFPLQLCHPDSYPTPHPNLSDLDRQLSNKCRDQVIYNFHRTTFLLSYGYSSKFPGAFVCLHVSAQLGGGAFHVLPGLAQWFESCSVEQILVGLVQSALYFVA